MIAEDRNAKMKILSSPSFIHRDIGNYMSNDRPPDHVDKVVLKQNRNEGDIQKEGSPKMGNDLFEDS